jgi:RNA polymerase sigma-70 factor, ECF subfamily
LSNVEVEHSPAAPAPEDNLLLERLRAGDEDAFVDLVRQHGAAMLRVAQVFVKSRAVAEEVVQETWLGVLNGIDRFEGRSSLKTWLFRILTNVAQTRGQREGRSVPFSSLITVDDDAAGIDPDRFLPDGDRWAGHWASAPRRLDLVPEASIQAKETRATVQRAIDALPQAQRAVITLRDVVGCNAEETRDALDISEANQRVLLHRARSKVRAALESYLEGAP